MFFLRNWISSEINRVFSYWRSQFRLKFYWKSIQILRKIKIISKKTADLSLENVKSYPGKLRELVCEKYSKDKNFTNERIILGLLLEKWSAEIIYDIKVICSEFVTNSTNRVTLEFYSSIFDSLNLITPITI